MEEKKQTRIVLVMIILITTLPIPASFAVTKDLFEYEPGAELIGLGDASGGWDGPWDGWTNGTSALIVEGSMTTSPVRKGNRLECIQLVGGGEGDNMITRYFAEPAPDEKGAVYWMSFCMQKHNDNNFDSWCGLALTDGYLWVGKPYNADCYGTDGFEGFGVVKSDVPVTTEAWLVLRMEMLQGKSDIAYLWINPDPAMDPNVTPPDVTTGFNNKSAGFTEIIVDWGSGPDAADNAADFTIDEIRWGTSWYEVRGFTDGQARNPSPPDEETLVVCDIPLSWDPPLGVSNPVYNVYVDPNLSILQSRTGTAYSSLGQTETTFDPTPDLKLETTYYWVVDVTNGDPGTTWSFATCPKKPVFTVQPDSQTVPAGTTVIFTVESPNTTDYQWYKADSADTSDVGTPIDGATQTTLTVENVQLADEGFYYCLGSNDEDSGPSSRAQLMTKRLVGWWKLNGDFTDSVQDEVPGAPAHDGAGDPNFISDGIEGLGLEFLEDERLVIVPDSGDYFNFHPQGMTVSIWIRPQDIGDWDGIISKQLRPELFQDAVGWCIDINGRSDWGLTGAHFTLRGSHGDLFGNDDDEDMFEGEWHLVTAVMNPDTQTSRIYIDGTLRNETDVYDFDAIEMNDEPLVFGAEDQYNTVPYTGHIDDVRIFNYPLSSIDVAILYTNFVEGVDVCAEYPAHDFNRDCIVNLDDFATVAGDWMSCNIVPTCIDP
jgi:hypothetical protein